MIKEIKRGARTESLSLRIDPKTKFVLEFMVRATGLRLTDLIEKAIKDYADKTRVGMEQFEEGKNWLTFWHPEEGVRMIKLLFDPDVQTTYEEDELKDFIELHREFFYDTIGGTVSPTVAFVQVLWPEIDRYLSDWRDNKSKDRWATGRAMLVSIKAAGMLGPTWPRGATTPSPPPSRRTAASAKLPSMDDEIPF